MEYRPSKPEYWSETALAHDMKQAFDICNGCRLCYNLCPSFPALFTFVEGHDDNAELLTEPEMDRVADLCFQCKICFMKCPYTPPHRFDLDFPRLMLRSKAQRVKTNGMGASDRFLGDPERSGALGTQFPALSNWALETGAWRRLMERRVGIDRRRRLPRFTRERFSRWVAKRPVPAQADVVLFSTCTVEYHEGSLGQAAMRVLEHNGIRAVVPAGQRCCGMPAMDGGDIDGAVERARTNIGLLAPYVARGIPIVALQPTCSYVLKEEYPLLVEGEVARQVAEATVDLTDFLAQLAREGRLKDDFVREGEAVLYHVPCHSRVQGSGPRGREVLERVPGTRVTLVEQCAGIDGTWGLKREFYDQAVKVAAKLDRAIRQHPDHQVCSDCKLAGLQIYTAAGQEPRHPVEYLAAAYGFGAGQGENLA
jgi:glycerol-3-phosphate dehydrogenase subunit C